MRIPLLLVSVLFGALSLVAAASQLKKPGGKLTHILMILGSVLLLAAAACNWLAASVDGPLSLAGGLLICGAAIANGVRGGSFHWQHHVVRLALTALLVVGFFLL